MSRNKPSLLAGTAANHQTETSQTAANHGKRGGFRSGSRREIIGDDKRTGGIGNLGGRGVTIGRAEVSHRVGGGSIVNHTSTGKVSQNTGISDTGVAHRVGLADRTNSQTITTGQSKRNVRGQELINCRRPTGPKEVISASEIERQVGFGGTRARANPGVRHSQIGREGGRSLDRHGNQSAQGGIELGERNIVGPVRQRARNGVGVGNDAISLGSHSRHTNRSNKQYFFSS